MGLQNNGDVINENHLLTIGWIDAVYGVQQDGLGLSSGILFGGFGSLGAFEQEPTGDVHAEQAGECLECFWVSYGADLELHGDVVEMRDDGLSETKGIGCGSVLPYKSAVWLTTLVVLGCRHEGRLAQPPQIDGRQQIRAFREEKGVFGGVLCVESRDVVVSAFVLERGQVRHRLHQFSFVRVAQGMLAGESEQHTAAFQHRQVGRVREVVLVVGGEYLSRYSFY